MELMRQVLFEVMQRVLYIRVCYYESELKRFLYAEVDGMKKQSEIDKKAMDELVRERDILNKNCLKVSKYRTKLYTNISMVFFLFPFE